ncbi:MAG TPA: plastocyanin/azurin family copper-binding protein [Gemmatimonadaceae bacterium]|jgi:plastocyanin|nr:plastocyanin/azurin family copper-binding protein [Gemmatimonadaceae bacterium]
MRSLRFMALLTGAVVCGACGGGENKAADQTAAATPPAANAPPAAISATPAAGAVAPAPITGTTHDVKMIADAKGYRFDPAAITIKTGDGIRYINVSGGPHNVAFDPTAVPATVKPQLAANMPNTMSELSSALLMNPNDSYTISFGNITPGTYEVRCTPHLAMNILPGAFDDDGT